MARLLTDWLRKKGDLTHRRRYPNSTHQARSRKGQQDLLTITVETHAQNPLTGGATRGIPLTRDLGGQIETMKNQDATISDPPTGQKDNLPKPV